jgi:uncharacterized membrane protein YjgN (DUF898 family)
MEHASFLSVLGLITSLALRFKLIFFILPCLFLNDSHFVFTASLGKYMLIHLKGMVLTLISFGLFAPWYRTEVTSYVASSVGYPGKSAAFLGKPKELFKYYIGALFIPVIIIVIALSRHLTKYTLEELDSLSFIYNSLPQL